MSCWEGFKDFEFTKCLIATAEMLGVWGNHVNKAFRNNKKQLEGEIKLLQQGTNLGSSARMAEVKRQLVDLLIREETHWRQCSKFFWLKDGDRNTRFSIRWPRRGGESTKVRD